MQPFPSTSYYAHHHPPSLPPADSSTGAAPDWSLATRPPIAYPHSMHLAGPPPPQQQQQQQQQQYALPPHLHHEQQQQPTIKLESQPTGGGPDRRDGSSAPATASYDFGQQPSFATDPESSTSTPERGSSTTAAAAAAAAAEAAERKEQQRKALRRNMACHQCRRRKLKCDSLRPQCTPCSKARQSFLESLPPGMEPPEMSCLCTYDEMNGPFKKSSAAPARKSTSHTVEPKAAKRGAAADDADDDESARARRLEEVELENSKLKAQLNQLSHKLASGSSPPREWQNGLAGPSSSSSGPQVSPTFLVSPQPYGAGSYDSSGALNSPPFPPTYAPQHLSASWTQTPPIAQPPLSTTLPPLLLPPPPPLSRPRPDSHLHYPFVNQQQQQQFLLPPIQSPLSPGDDFSDSLVHPFDPRTGDVTSPLGNREAVIKTLGGLDALEKAIKQMTTTTPLMRHVWPPFKTKYPPANSSPVHLSSPTSTTSSASYTAAPYSLHSRLFLPSTSPMRIHTSLLLAISAAVNRGTENSQVWAIEAGREIMFAKLAGISGEEETDARARERKAIDVVQAAILLVALHHFEGSWSEFHNFAPLASLLCDLVGLDPVRAPVLPEYSVSVLRRPNPADDTYEERRRTVQCAKFVHNVYLVFSARGSWDSGHEVSLRSGEDLTSTPCLLNLQSIYLISRVEKFNKTLRPPPAPLPANANLLQTIEDQVAFQVLEGDIDSWCVKLGMLDPSQSSDWEGEIGMGELLGGKVLAEHARLLLYCVHLNNSSNDSQRRACLSAAQSISQSCVVASSIPPLAVPSFCLHSYFFAAQILLRFLASAQLSHDDWLASQLTQQVSVIKHTFERLSGSYRVARNFHKLLETAMTEGSGVIPQSFAMVFDLAFYTPK